MSALSWFLEFLTGGVFLTKILFNDGNNTIILYLVLFDSLLNFVIIPSSYLLNTEVIKGFIIANGWMHYLRTLFPSNKIHPVENQDVP